jgi:L-threonylcarbamoyladenylate synthase
MPRFRVSYETSLYSAHLAHAAYIIKQGGIVAYPTESCYGLGCHPRNRQAIRRLIRIKKRPQHKGLILVAADFSQLQPYVADISPDILATWPGPHTWLLPATPYVLAEILGQHPRVAVRVTDHAPAAELCRAAGTAIVSTSANRSGQRPAKTYRETLWRLGESVDFVLPGRTGKQSRPSAIVDAVTHDVIRAG